MTKRNIGKEIIGGLEEIKRWRRGEAKQSMLFLVISTPRPERPSSMTRSRKKFWRWIDPMLKSRRCRWVYARTGRGAVALFDVKSNEELHALLNKWAEIIPAHFDIYPLIDANAARRFLGKGTREPK